DHVAYRVPVLAAHRGYAGLLLRAQRVEDRAADQQLLAAGHGEVDVLGDGLLQPLPGRHRGVAQPGAQPRAELRQEAADDREQDVLLRGVVVIQRGRGQAHRLGEVAYPDGVVTAPGEQGGGAGEDVIGPLGGLTIADRASRWHRASLRYGRHDGPPAG